MSGSKRDEIVNIEKMRAQEIVRLHSEVVGNLRQSLEKAIRIGQLLSEQKQFLKHGEFIPWLEANIPFADRTARNYMRLYRERDRLKTETISDLKGAYALLTNHQEEWNPDDRLLARGAPDRLELEAGMDHLYAVEKLFFEIADGRQEIPDTIEGMMYPADADSYYVNICLAAALEEGGLNGTWAHINHLMEQWSASVRRELEAITDVEEMILFRNHLRKKTQESAERLIDAEARLGRLLLEQEQRP